MYVMGLDIGTTSISGVVLDGDTGTVLETVSRSNGKFLPAAHPWERTQDAAAIWQSVSEIAEQLTKAYAPLSCIGVTGQMHGIVYVDKNGSLLSPLYTWQDGRAAAEENGKSSVQVLADKTGYQVPAGYGCATHFYHVQHGLVPEGAATFCTIHDYVAMRLCGRKTPVMDTTDAASFGLFDILHSRFDTAAIARAGMDAALLPQVAEKPVVIGETAGGVPVAVAVGDNQASFIGSVRDNALLINIGTGSQVSAFSPEVITIPGVETRPFPDGGCLLVGAPLCGGRAYALLERFFREAAALCGGSDSTAYRAMEQAAEAVMGQRLPVVAPTFCGTRQHPNQTAVISGLTEDNFTPAHLTAGLLYGMVNELRQLYDSICTHLHTPPKAAVGSGNGIRKNRLLQQILGEVFGLPVSIPSNGEEAVCGAAFLAMAAGGLTADLAQARSLITYTKTGEA